MEKKQGVVSLTSLYYSTAHPGQLLKLFLYDVRGFYIRPIYFKNNPGEDEISVDMAEALAKKHIEKRLEVRITTMGDELVFHAQAGVVTYPPNHHRFWEELKK